MHEVAELSETASTMRGLTAATQNNTSMNIDLVPSYMHGMRRTWKLSAAKERSKFNMSSMYNDDVHHNSNLERSDTMREQELELEELIYDFYFSMTNIISDKIF